MTAGSLLIRADAGVAIGTGHVMRCLALAQAWQDAGGRVIFAMAAGTLSLRERLRSESCEVRDLTAAASLNDEIRQIVALAGEECAGWAVLDGYQFGEDHQQALKAEGLKVLFVDDYGHTYRYAAHFVLNQNVCAREALYARRNPHTQLLLGPHYCLLRREFSAWREWKRDVRSTAQRVLVTMGGSDPENVTQRVLEALSLVRVPELEAIVAVGGSNPDSRLHAVGDGKKISVRRDVSNMAELMAWADVAVSSAGSTCWELCLLGLPSLLVDVAENQTAVARELGLRDCAIHLGGPRELTPRQLADRLEELLRSEETRFDMSARCRELVDGRGAVRVTSAMLTGLRLRPLREEDCRLLWEWANDPQVRAAAFSANPIPWEEHALWFASKMKDPDCSILIAEDERRAPVGQFRVNWRPDGDGEIDVSVSALSRGAGYGEVLIDLGVARVFSERGERLHALVKTENQPSRRAFERAGFRSLGEETVKAHSVIHYVRIKEFI